MRYLYFIILLIFCFSASAQQPPEPSCGSRSVQSACTDMSKISGSTLSYFNNACYSAPNRHQAFESGSNCTGSGTTAIVCYSNCQCPEGYRFNTVQNGGIKSSSCVPDDPTENPDECEHGTNPETGLCNNPTCPDNGPRIDGQCPVCIHGRNPDGTCADDPSDSSSSSPQSSAPASSSPASSAPSSEGSGDGSASSSGSGDGSGGDGSGNGSGGSGGDGSGGNNNGNTSSASSSGNPNNWTPVSGYGNWIPVASNSPCPNKYIDANGQWWCSGVGTGSSSGSGGSSAASSANSSAGSSTSSSGSSNSSSSSCPAKPVCDLTTDNTCKTQLQTWQSNCGGSPLDGDFFDLPKEEGDGPPLSFSNSLTSFKDGLDELQNVQAISDFFTFDASGSCPIWQVQVSVYSVVIDQQCSPNIPWSLIRGVLIAVAVLLAARIALH